MTVTAYDRREVRFIKKCIENAKRQLWLIEGAGSPDLEARSLWVRVYLEEAVKRAGNMERRAARRAA